jgi:hypothetical protein
VCKRHTSFRSSTPFHMIREPRNLSMPPVQPCVKPPTASCSGLPSGPQTPRNCNFCFAQQALRSEYPAPPRSTLSHTQLKPSPPKHSVRDACGLISLAAHDCLDASIVLHVNSIAVILTIVGALCVPWSRIFETNDVYAHTYMYNVMAIAEVDERVEP